LTQSEPQIDSIEITMDAEDNKQSVAQTQQINTPMETEENKPGEVQIEQVNHTADSSPELHSGSRVVMEHQVYQGINLQTILAFLVCCILLTP
jgi:hypothetical protein